MPAHKCHSEDEPDPGRCQRNVDSINISAYLSFRNGDQIFQHSIIWEDILCARKPSNQGESVWEPKVC